MSYATISVFGQPKKLYWETLMKYMVSSQDRPQNFLIYSIHSEIDSFILYNADQTQETILDSIDTQWKEIALSIQNESKQSWELSNKQGSQIDINKQKFVAPDDENYEHEILWHLEFDGLVISLE